MSADQPVIVVSDLRVAFPEASEPVLENLSFTIDAGKTLALVGESGSGKSVTALALMGLLPSEARWSGRIELHLSNAGFEISEETDHEEWARLRGNVLSLMFQQSTNRLNPLMSVGRQIEETIVALGKATGSLARLMARDWLDRARLPDPDLFYDRYPHQLTEGEKQRVMIAMALCGHPALIIADEPTAALDMTFQREMFSLFKVLQQETGTALLLITRDLALAGELADEVLVLKQGETQEYGAAEQVLRFPRSEYARALIACRPLALAKGHRLPVLADFLEGLPPLPKTYRELKSGARPLLQVRQLRVWYSGRSQMFGPPAPVLRAVEDVSFDLLRGEVLGLVGESGSGKSSLSRAVFGLTPVESGTIHFAGEDLTHLSTAGWKKIRRRIQMIHQDPNASLNPGLTIGRQLSEILQVHRIVPASERDAECRRLMDLVELPLDTLDRYPRQFSDGESLRIAIARAMALRPELILCDEIVSALDVNEQAQILNLLKSLQIERGLSILFISHDLNVVHYIADHILVMQSGKIVERGTAERVMLEPEQEYTKALIAAMPHAR